MRIDSFGFLTRQLGLTKSKIDRVLKQLAAQKNLNSFVEDPVGTALLENVKSSLRSLQAVNSKNLVQAEGLTAVAEDYAQQIYDKVQDLKELALEATGEIDPSRRLEIKELFAEGLEDITSLVSTAEFNGIQLFDGSFETKIQIGDQAGQHLSLEWHGLNLTNLGLVDKDIKNVDNAVTALAALEAATTTVAGVQSKIAAAQTSLEVRENANELQIENLEDVRSNIEDLDLAEATSRLAALRSLQESQLALLNSSLNSQAEAFRILFLRNL